MRRIQTPVEESMWLSKALKGDGQAFTRLVETYEKPVYNLCYRMLGNAQDAEDAAQETFLRAYQSLKKFDTSRSFATWLLSIAAHHCIDQLRKRRLQVISVEEFPEPEILDPEPGVEAILSQKIESQKIQNLLSKLAPPDRAAVIMYYWYDFSYEEICQSLSISISALKSRLHRSRRLLAEEWIREQKIKPERGSGKQSRTGKLSTEGIVS